MPNEWFNRVAGGIDAAKMDGYFEVGASDILAPPGEHPMPGYQVDFGQFPSIQPGVVEPLADVSIHPYASPLYDAGLFGIGDDLGQSGAVAFAQVMSSVVQTGNAAMQAYFAFEGGQLSLELAEEQLESLKARNALMQAQAAAVTQGGVGAGGMPQQMQTEWGQSQGYIAQLEAAINAKKPFWQKPMVIIPLAGGAVLLLLLLRR